MKTKSEEVTIYCDASPRNNYTNYCIAGVILGDSEKVILDIKLNNLKKEFWNQNWETVELKSTYITDKSECFWMLNDDKMKLFLKKLEKIIFDEMKLKVLPLYDKKGNLTKNTSHPSSPWWNKVYFYYVAQYNEFLFKHGITGKMIFDEGDDNFKELLKREKEQELLRVFHISTSINMTRDEIDNCLIDSRKENALQIADLFAYTTCLLYSESPNKLHKRIFGKKWLPLPFERLTECYVKQPHNTVLTARPKF